MWKVYFFCGVFVFTYLNKANASTKVSLKWDRVEVEVSPLSQVHRNENSYNFTLDGKTITVFSGPNNRVFKTVGTIGDALETVTTGGSKITNKYSFRNNAVKITTIWQDYYSIKEVKIEDVNSCSLSIIYYRMPGQKYFTDKRQSNHEKMYMSDIHAECVSCQVHNAPSNSYNSAFSFHIG